MKHAATARAHANIALIKYWGKRDAALNLPAAGSLSLTLEALTTTTTVTFDSALMSDQLILGGTEVADARISPWLDVVRTQAGFDTRARIESHNDFPTASGLASSASAYAALALAATAAAGLTLPARELSVLARRGSGSAARSIFGGLVRMHAGRAADGTDSYAEPLPHDWPLRMIVAVVGGGAKKAHGSRDAMEHCARTSPLYRGWLAAVPEDLAAATTAIEERDLAALGAITEASAMTMHAAAIASRPAILYWQPTTLACLAQVHSLRERGIAAFATMDAGPHVKVLTSIEHAAAVAAAMRDVAGVTHVYESAPGPGASLVTP